MPDNKREMAEAIWLLYFNRSLLEKGIITERAFFELQRMIQTRK